MQSGMAQARLRIKETLDAHPELNVILDASGNASSRLRARFLSQDGDNLNVQLPAALGQNLLVSITGEFETVSGRQTVFGKYRVSSCKIAGIGKYQAELTPESVTEESPQPTNHTDDEPDHYQTLQVSRQADTDTKAYSQPDTYSTANHGNFPHTYATEKEADSLPTGFQHFDH